MYQRAIILNADLKLGTIRISYNHNFKLGLKHKTFNNKEQINQHICHTFDVKQKYPSSKRVTELKLFCIYITNKKGKSYITNLKDIIFFE